MKSNEHRKERGAALIVSLIFTMVILAIGIGMLTFSTHELTATRAQGDTIVSRNIAEAGVDRALVSLAENPSLRFSTPPTGMQDQPVTASVNGTTQTLGAYTITAIEDTSMGVRVKAEAVAGEASTATGPKTRIAVIAYQSSVRGPFAQGMFGKDSIKINGNVTTDSYNSEDGSYNSQIPGNNGSIRTNGTSNGAITVNGNSDINGNIQYGPGGSNKTVKITGNSKIDDGDADPSNDITAAPAPLNLPEIEIPPITDPIGIPLGKGAVKSVSYNGNHTININTDGVYEVDDFSINGNVTVNFNGDIALVINNAFSANGNAEFNVNGSLTIYAKKSFKMNGNVHNNKNAPTSDQQPKNFIIYGLPTCTDVHVNGNAGLVGVVYAPDAEVQFNGNAGAFGAVIGKKIDLNGNVKFHYDESLGELMSSGDGTYRIRTWSEG